MNPQRLSLSIANAVAVVRFSNPPQWYMDDDTVQDLAAALDDIENNSDECVDGPVLARALQVAFELAGKSPQVIAHIKRLVRGYGCADTGPGLAAERTLFCDLMTSRSGIEQMHAMNSGKVDLRDRRPQGTAR